MTLIQIYKKIDVKQWLFLFGFWTFVASIVTSQFYFTGLKNNLDPQWFRLFIEVLPIWYLWALVSPLIIWMVQAHPITATNWGKAVSLYVLTGVGLLGVLSNLSIIYMVLLHGYIDLTNTSWAEYIPYFAARFTNDFLIYSFVVSLVVVMNAYAASKSRVLNLALMELKNNQLHTQLTRAQLQALKLQLNPHFLFNTLHTISSLTLSGDKETSVDVATKLGDFLRRSLEYEEQQFVSLGKELQFLDLYLEIESARFKDRLTVRREVCPTCLTVPVPNLILQPLIENAIKHGISKRIEATVVELKIACDTDRLVVELFNEGPALRDGFEIEGQGGIGLKNIMNRLDRLYGEAYVFHLEADARREGVVALLEIPVVQPDLQVYARPT